MVLVHLAISHLAVGLAAAAVGINGFTNLFALYGSAPIPFAAVPKILTSVIQR